MWISTLIQGGAAGWAWLLVATLMLVAGVLLWKLFTCHARLRREMGRQVDKVRQAEAGLEASRKQVEAVTTLMRKSEGQMRFLADNLPGVMLYQVDTGVDGRTRHITYVSRGVEPLHEFTEAEVLADASLIYGSVHEEDRVTLAKLEQAAVDTMSLFQAEVRIRSRSGKVKWVRFTSAPHRNAEQHLIWDGIEVDITDARRAGETIRERDINLQALLNAVPESEFLMDRDGTILAANEVVCARLGRSMSELVGANVYALHPANVIETRRKLVEEVLVTKTPCCFEDVRGDRVIENHVYPILDDKGEVGRLAIVGIDITERRQTERERARLQAQLVQAQKIESVGRLAGGVAHDFNNMLGVILGHVDLCLDAAEMSPQFRADLQEIRKAAERSASLTRQLLAFARKQVVAPKVLDLNAVVEGMLTMLRRLIGADIALVWRPQAGLWPIYMDASQVDQVMANLCVNARDATAGAGSITIVTENIHVTEAGPACREAVVPGDYVVLSIADNGSGMDEEVLAHLFEPFFTTKELGKGTGLGIATVYGITKQNKGFIDVQSEPGRGTTVRIYLPRMHTSAAGPEAASGAPPWSGGDETVLLVDDEPGMLQACRQMLERLGYTVLAAGTGAEALRLARDHARAIQLLVTDVVMAGVNGVELAQQMRQLCPGLKCLFMSGFSADVLLGKGGVDTDSRFIQKPFSMQDLAVALRDVLGAGRRGGLC